VYLDCASPQTFSEAKRLLLLLGDIGSHVPDGHRDAAAQQQGAAAAAQKEASNFLENLHEELLSTLKENSVRMLACNA